MSSNKKSLFREYAEALFLALLLAVLVRTFVVQAFRIPSGSMIPSLLIGDQILVDKLVYKFRDPERGEIIVFKYPVDETRDFIKRIIGLPGEKLEIRDRKVYINDHLLDDTGYAYHDVPANAPSVDIRDNLGPIIIPENQYFMMGDNRENSQDSRFWGFLDRSQIVGRAFIIYWSRDISSYFPSNIRWGRFGLLLEKPAFASNQ